MFKQQWRVTAWTRVSESLRNKLIPFVSHSAALQLIPIYGSRLSARSFYPSGFLRAVQTNERSGCKKAGAMPRATRAFAAGFLI